jgi:hypothetical protein
MRNSILSVLALVAIVFSGNVICLSQTSTGKLDAKAEKLKRKVAEIGVGDKITAVTADGRETYGKVGAVGTDDFQIVEVDSGRTVTLKYSELKKIHHGDGERNVFTGKRKNPRRGWIIGAAIFGALAVILAIGLGDKDF